MIKKKLIGILAMTMLSVSLLVGCSKPVEEEAEKSIDFTKTAEEIILNYSEKGMDVLKSNFPESTDMEIALKNIGRTPTDMSFKTLDGETLTLENGIFKELKDKKVILEIAQAHCPYCKETTPIIHKVLEDEKYKDVELVTVFVNSTEEEIKAYYEELNLEVPQYVIINEDKSIVQEFSLAVTPTTVYLNGSGKISYIKNGSMDETTFKDILKTSFEDEPIYNMLNE